MRQEGVPLPERSVVSSVWDMLRVRYKETSKQRFEEVARYAQKIQGIAYKNS